MASPQRPFPGNEPPLEDVKKVDREVGEDLWSRLWIWIIIAAAIVAIIWITWGFGGTGGWWRNRNHPPVAQLVTNGPPGNPLPVGSGVAVLNAPNKTPYIGKPFDVNNVLVQNIVSNSAFWVGGNNSNPMLVILSAGNSTIAAGDVVSVTGTVQKAPSAQQAKSQWSLNNDGVNRLAREGVYIQASQVANAQF